MNRYRIKTITEETACCQCGFPLYVTDIAFEEDGEVFCSTACGKESEKEESNSERIES
jgi:uncharacterized Zn finger protein (UPF0148 family)